MNREIAPLWSATSGPGLENQLNPSMLLAPAKQLRTAELAQVRTAFESSLYILGTEFLWRRSLSVLKAQLGKLSMKLVAEILGRPDIQENADPELVLTDSDAISVAHQLGMLSDKAALDLRQSLEQLAHFSRPDADAAEMDGIEALRILRSCVSHVLSFDTMSVAVDFTKIRQNLQRSVLSLDSDSFKQITSSPYFFKRVVLRTLLADAELAEPQSQSTVLQNLVSLGEKMWGDLLDAERWTVGQTYAAWSANNLKRHVTYLRVLLSNIQGFDYVPENLRSNTYTEAATNVLRVHEASNNYYNEPAALKSLLDLGTSIPGPATALTMRAILACWLGNSYGNTWAAESYCNQAFRTMSPSFWTLYLSRILPGDEYLLTKLLNDKPWARWCTLVTENNLINTNAGNISFLFAEATIKENKRIETFAKIRQHLRTLGQSA